MLQHDVCRSFSWFYSPLLTQQPVSWYPFHSCHTVMRDAASSLICIYMFGILEASFFSIASVKSDQRGEQFVPTMC